MKTLKHVINSLTYRFTGKIFQKINTSLDPNWKTVDVIGDESTKNIFGYRLGYPVNILTLKKKWWENPIFYQKQNVKRKTRPLLIIGEGWTGSSAVVHYLCEFRWILQYGTEFRLIKDPGGIIELEATIVDHWTHWNASAAIRRFIQLAKLHARDNRYKFLNEYLQIGFNNTEFCNGNFMKLTEQYVDDLVFLRFPGNWFMDDCGKSTIGILVDNIKRRFGYSKEEFYMIHPEREKFIKATRKYINSIIEEFNLWASSEEYNVVDSNIDWIIFDQAVSPMYSYKALDYFENAKVIIVDRDPRDMYLSVSLSRSRVPVAKHRSYFPNDPESFAKFYRKLRENSEIEEGPSLLRISFEDFNLRHEETSARIREFLDLDIQDHLIPHTFYKNEISSKRVGKWKSCSEEESEAIKIIAEMLPEYCYQLNV